MNQQQALVKLRKILGAKMGYRVDPKALVGDARIAKANEARELRLKRTAANEAMEARRLELLKGDAEFQRLKAEHETLRKAHEEASYYAHHDRIDVGVMGSMFFTIKASGETWAEVVEKLTATETA